MPLTSPGPLTSQGNLISPGPSSFSQGLGSGLGSGLGGGLGSIFGSIFDLFNNPANSAGKQLQGIPDILKQYLGPYAQGGVSALSDLQKQYGNILGDPGGFINKVGADYKQSPGYQFALQQALQSSGNAAAAGGMAGSPMHEQNNMGIATGMANQDYNKWLGTALGQYDRGLSGEEGLYQGGLKASGDLSSGLANYLQQMAGLKYAGGANRNQDWGNLFGGISSLFGL